MIERTTRHIEHEVQRNTAENNFWVFQKSIDPYLFNRLMESFWDKEKYNRIITEYLNSTEKKLWELWDIKIDLSDIYNHINDNNLDIELEELIAKIFVQKLYDAWATNIPFRKKFEECFEVEAEDIPDLTDVSEDDIPEDLKITGSEKRNYKPKTQKDKIKKRKFDFMGIKSSITKFWWNFSEIIDGITVSNSEIFQLLWNKVNKLQKLDWQDVSNRPMILNLLEFELKDTINFVRSKFDKFEWDTIGFFKSTRISGLFDNINDPRIKWLKRQKDIIGYIYEKLKTEDITSLIKDLSKQWIPTTVLEHLEDFHSWKINYATLKNHLSECALDIDKKIWTIYIKKTEEELWADSEFVKVLNKFFSKDFDFSQLSPKEQTIFWQIMTRKYKKENLFIKQSWLNQQNFIKFLEDIYDFEKDNLSIHIDRVWDLNLKINREVNQITDEKWKIKKTFYNTENFEDKPELLPLKFLINIDGNSKNIIEDIETTSDSPFVASGVMKPYMTKSWPKLFWNGYELEIRWQKITAQQLDELFECKNDINKIKEKLEGFWLYEIFKNDLERVYREKPNGWISVEGFPAKKIKYPIFAEILKDLDVNVLKRNLIFDWTNIDCISTLYAFQELWRGDTVTQNDNELINNHLLHWNRDWWDSADEVFNDIVSYYEGHSMDDIPDDYINEDIRRKLREFRGELDDWWKNEFKNRLEDLVKNNNDLDDFDDDFRNDIRNAINNELSGDRDGGEEEHLSTEELECRLGVHVKEPEQKTVEEIFTEAWDKLPWDKNCKLEKWTKLYFDLWKSEIPPKRSESYYCFEVVDVWADKFTIEAVWGELPSGLVGEKYTFDKTAQQLEYLLNWATVYKVRAAERNNRNSSMEVIGTSWIFEKIQIFWEWKDQIRLKWDKFVKKIVKDWKEEEVEVKYFNNISDCFDETTNKQWKKIVKYKIENVDSSKWTVKISSNFDDYDDNWDAKKYSYENELTFEQFIILVEWKNLLWASELEQKGIESKYELAQDPGRNVNRWKKIKWASIWAFMKSMKGLKEKFEGESKKRIEAQTANIDEFLYSQRWLNLWWKGSKLAHAFWLHWLWFSFDKLYSDFYTSREERTWKQIDFRYRSFEAEPNFSEFFYDNLLPILQKEWYKWDLDDDEKYMFAAAFLIMVKTEWPYTREFSQDIWKWNWVLKFLWSEHQDRFKQFYDEKKRDIEQVKNENYDPDVVLNLQEQLNKMEMEYIIWVIDGVAPYNKWWVNDKELKSIWWLKFKDKLKENYSWFYDKHTETKNKLNTFFAAEEQYLRTIAAGRFEKAIPALERMCELAKSPREAFEIKWYLLWAMLMWVIKNNSSKSTMNSFYDTARSMGFPPWFRVRDMRQQQKVQVLLDWITNWQFSDKTWYKIWDFETWQLKDGKYWFTFKFQWYWKANGERLLKKIEDLSYTDTSKPEDKSIMDLADEKENINSSIFKEYIENSRSTDYFKQNSEVWPIFLVESPKTGISNNIQKYIPNKWDYQDRAADKDDAKKFWNNAKNIIPKWRVNSKNKVFDTFSLYFNRFDTILREEHKELIVRSLNLVRKEKLEHPAVAKYILRYVIKWNIHKQTSWTFPPEFEEVMKNFVDFFYDNIESIDDTIVKKAFEKDEQLQKAYEKDFLMLDRRQYKNYRMGSLNNGKNTYNKHINLYLRKKNYENKNLPNYTELDMDDIINSRIEEIWKSCNNYNVSPDVDVSWIAAGDYIPIEENKEYTKQVEYMEDLEEWRAAA